MDVATRNRLTLQNLGLAYHFVRKLGHRHQYIRILGEDDAVQIAAITLMHAIELFDPSRPCTLATYACDAMYKNLRKAALEGGTIHTPIYVFTDPNTPKHRLHAARMARRQCRALLDDGDDAPAARTDDALDEADERAATRGHLDRARQCLTQQQQDVIRMRFDEGRTPDECAAALGLSTTRVHQVRGDALKKLSRCKDLRSAVGR